MDEEDNVDSLLNVISNSNSLEAFEITHCTLDKRYIMNSYQNECKSVEQKWNYPYENFVKCT